MQCLTFDITYSQYILSVLRTQSFWWPHSHVQPKQDKCPMKYFLLKKKNYGRHSAITCDSTENPADHCHRNRRDSYRLPELGFELLHFLFLAWQC